MQKPPPPPASISSLIERSDYVASLLKECKDTYGWSAVRTMNYTELTLLLQRLASEPKDREAVSAYERLFQNGLLELLSTPRKQRQVELNHLASSLYATPDDLNDLLSRFESRLRLSRADKRLAGSNTKTRTVVSVPPWKRYKWLILIGSLFILSSVGISIGFQLYRTRTELSRQKENSQKQKDDIEKLKQQLADQKPARTKDEEVATDASIEGESSNDSRIPSSSETGTSSSPMPDLPATADSETDARPSAITSSIRWDGCDVTQGSPSKPRQGDVWWPVVAPASALENVREHCRSDAFLNRDGNVQVASFNDRSQAEEWARLVSADTKHPYRLWVGDSTVYGVEP